MYGAAMLCLAALYSILPAIGSVLSVRGIATGAVVYWIVYGLAGIIIWNILKYAIPVGNRVIGRFIVISSGIMVVALTTGAETLAIYVANSSLEGFAMLIPVKVFVSSLTFALFCLFYRRSIEERAEDDELKMVKPQQQEHIIERITVKGGQKIKVIPVGEIEYLQADGDYVAIVTDEGRWLKEQTMKYFEEHLPADHFIRIHRSHIVNMGRISRIERYGNLYQVALRGGEKIKVSATGYKLLKERMKL